MKTILDVFLQYKSSMISRDFIIDYFVESEYMTKEEAIKHHMIRPGKLFQEDGKICVITEALAKDTIGAYEILSLDNYKLSFYKRFQLTKGMIENYNEDTPIETTVGVFMLNYLVLIRSFGSIIPYINGKWELKKIEKQIVKLALDEKISADQIYRYVDNVYFLSSLNDFCVPGVSEQCITANPIVDERRRELLEQYKDQLDDPNIMVMIENELIKLDKDLLKDDMSSGFLIKGKNFDVQRKRMFVIFGLNETFGDDVKGYDFGTFNLNDGWNLGEMDIIANDIRRGSYNRAKSTALGGYESKVLGRNFQDSSIVEDDCRTKRGVRILLTKNEIKNYVNRNIIVGDKLIELTEDNINQYLDKEVVIRSPMYCNSQDGYCYACMDSRFKKMGVRLLGITTISIGSTFVTNSLKSMHGTKVDVFEIDDLAKIIV